jgi:hypothetical protein
MANILGDDKQQPVLMLGRLGWPFPRIEAATGVRREAASVPKGGQDLAFASLAEHRAPTPKSGESALWRGPFRLPGAPAVLAPAGQPGAHGQRPRAVPGAHRASPHGG